MRIGFLTDTRSGFRKGFRISFYVHTVKTIVMEGKSRNAVEALIGILRCPIAERDGWKFDAEECSMWADELEEFLRKIQ
jgi:hypothetical protein